MKVEYSSSSVRTWITISFFVLAIVLELTMARYWSAILEPRLRSQAQTNAQLLAQSQAIALADVLSRNDLNDASAKQEIQSVFDHLLLIKDPDIDEHFFISLSLEVDYDAVAVTPGILELSQGNMDCLSCFEAPVELYSRETEELLGIATFYVSDVFFKNIKNELKDRFIIEGVIVFAILLLLWLIVINLVRSLYQQIEQRKKTHEALLVAKEQAESANEARGQFLANMSHEIRTPMNAIIGLCYIVLKSDLTTFQRNYLTKVHSSARSLLTLINDILDFSKIEAGKFDIEHIEFDMDEVLENLSQMIIPKSDEKALDILYCVDSDVPYQLKGDPFRLGQVLLNLINNAIKFTEQGEIVISIKVAQMLEDNKIKLEFCVKDTGVGIAENARDKLFSSFTQADSSMSRKYGGTGLGLAICKNLAEMMSGEIWVESELGKGSSFYFTAVFELDDPAPFDRFIIPEEIRNINVLVVDDSETSRQIYTQMMASFNFNVWSADSADKAIEMVKAAVKDNPVELILMDWQMPGLDGITAASMIKSDTSLPKMPSIILISAHAKEEAFYEAKDVLDAYLIKPVCQSTLYDCIVGIFCQVPRKSYADFSCESIRSKVVSNFTGKHILLVEDNKTNREVAINLLDDVQLSTDWAENGKQAIDKLSSNHYDLILMDVQMPQMDGITATKIIREQINKDIPIIAMTAHAMQGDKDKCLAVGMNDYLTKPIDVEHFYQTLAKWLPDTINQMASSIGESRFDGSPGETHFLKTEAENTAYPGIDYTEAMKRLIGNGSLLQRLIANFELHNSQNLAMLEQSIERKQWQQAKQIVHGIKGEAGNIAASEVYELAVALESLLETEHSQVPDLMEKFKLAIGVVFATSAQVRKQIAQANHPQNQDSQNEHSTAKKLHHTEMEKQQVDVHQLLAEITELLAKNNMKAKTQIELLEQYLTTVEYEFELSHLGQCMDVLDFKGALHQIEALSDKLRDTEQAQ